MKKLFTLVFVALLFSVLGAGIKKTLYKDYGIVVFHPDSLISVRAHQIVWGNFWVIQSDSTDTMSMTPDKMTIDSITITDYLHCTDDVQFDSTLTFGSGAIFSQPHADTIILTEGNIILTGKIRAGSFGTPLDVTSNRVYGAELHYYGNNYNVTALRARAQFKTTDATGDTAIGALIQAANNDGINASVLNGAKIEAIGKSTATGARIGTMRGLLVNTEWSAKDTITDLRILHLRTHTRDATADGCVDGTAYGLYIENEAVGGNGQALDAGIYLDGTNLSAGNKAFTYGADFSGVATNIGTADFRFRSGGLIDNPVDTFRITEAKLDLIGDALLDDVTIDSALTVEGKAVFNDTVMLGDSADKMILPKGSAIELYDTTDTDKFEIYDDGTNTILNSVNPFKLQGDYVRIGDGGTITYADGDGDLYVEDEIEADGSVVSPQGQFGTLYSLTNLFFDLTPARYGGIMDKTDDGTHFTVGNVDDYGNRHLIITDYANKDTDHDHDVLSTNPTLFVHSAKSPNTDNTEWISLTHDQTDGVIDVGSGAITLIDDVTLGDTINTVFLPKGTRLVLADSSGADSSIIYNDGTNLTFTSDNRIRFIQNMWFTVGDTIFLVDATGVDTNYVTNNGTEVIFSGNNPWLTNVAHYCGGDLNGTNDAADFTWHGTRWNIDFDNDDAIAWIIFHTEDSIKVDTSLHVMEWTGSGGIQSDGGIHGDIINDQFAYQCAGDIFNIASNSVLILGWISPATTEQDLSPHNHGATYQGTMTTGDQLAKGLVWKLDFDATDDYLSIVDHSDLSFSAIGTDIAFSMGGWIEVVATATNQVILSKWDEHTDGDPELREWKLWIDSDEKLNIRLADESVYAYEGKITNDALGVGWHLISVVYDGVGGTGASAGILIYIDGVVVAATLVDNGTYVDMEDLGAPVFVGAHKGTDNAVGDFFQGDMGHLFITLDELSADQNWELYLRTRGYYNE